jgi:hypothetical protein
MGNNPGGVGANSFYVLPLAVLFVILLFLFFFVEKVLSSVGGARGNNSIGMEVSTVSTAHDHPQLPYGTYDTPIPFPF